ncbi:hypothetical protein ABK040_016888 [Willaertia magna]
MAEETRVSPSALKKRKVENETTISEIALSTRKKLLHCAPNEILQYIFYFIENEKDLYQFAATCKTIFKLYLEECCNQLDLIRLEYLNNGENPLLKTFENIFPNLKRQKERTLNLFSGKGNTMLTYDEYLFGKEIDYSLMKIEKASQRALQNNKLQKEEEENEENDANINDSITNEDCYYLSFKDHVYRNGKLLLERDNFERNYGRRRASCNSIYLDNFNENVRKSYDLKGAEKIVRFFERPNEMTFDSFQKRLFEISKQNPIISLMIDVILEHNKTTTTKERFVIAGGYLLNILTSVGCCDLDIFCIQNGANDNEIHMSLRKILLKFEKLAKDKQLDYNVLKTNGTLNICLKTEKKGEREYKYPSATYEMSENAIQFVLRKIKSIEELLCFFDLDCCRILYDGENVFTILEGLRSLKYKLNILSSEHNAKGMYYERACKYGKRGFHTFFLNNKLKPLNDENDDEMIEEDEEIEVQKRRPIYKKLKNSCKGPDCTFYGTKETNGYCSSCFKKYGNKKLEEEEDEKQDEEEEEKKKNDKNNTSLSINHPLFYKFNFDRKMSELRDFIVKVSKLGDEVESVSQDYNPKYSFAWCFYNYAAPFFYGFPGNKTNDQDYDANLYSVVLKSFDYWMIDRVIKFGLKETLDWASEEFYSDGRYYGDFKDFKGGHQVDKLDDILGGIYDCITKKDIHYFCNNLRELLLKDSSFYFQEGYFESHLRVKYNFYKCYLCKNYIHCCKHEKEKFTMCNDCKVFNLKQRELKKDLTNKIAIVTGGRIKIGYTTALILLRNGATVIVTTRFVSDAFNKYKKEKDYKNWKDRLFLYPLNMKDGTSVLNFTNYIKNNFKYINILINNAAQTVRRPLQYYSKFIEEEKKMLLDQHFTSHLPNVSNQLNNNNTEIVTFSEKEIRNNCLNITTKYNLTKEDFENNLLYFPKDKVDKFGEPLDLRKENSWGLKLPEVDTVELLETQMINSIAPTIIISQLTDILKPHCNDLLLNNDLLNNNLESDNDCNDSVRFGHSFIINVTSHEGQFHTDGKTDTHIHTNMSKAALNMLTRSASNYYAKLGILMNSVDTGWISSSIETFKEPPLTVEDGAFRILYPILSGSFVYGKLFKDYKETAW